MKRDARTWSTYLLMAYYGYMLNILGPLTPFIQADLGLTYTLSSLHFTAFAAGILLAGMLGHFVILPLGRWRSLWLGAFGLSLGAVLLIVGRTPVVTIGAAFVMGTVGSLILAVVPAALSEQHGPRQAVALSEANLLASVVSIFAPVMVGWSAALAGSWRPALALAALVPLLLRVIFRAPMPAPVAAAAPVAVRVGLLPRLYWIFWAALLLGVAAEFCMVFWGAGYLVATLSLDNAAAAQWVSLFLLGMILGRLVGSRLLGRFSPLRVVTASLLLAGTGFLAYWQGGVLPVVLAGLFLTGLGISNFYPLLLSLALSAAPGALDRAGARATLASGFAILALPLLLGRLADAAGIHLAYGLVGVLLLALLGLLGLAVLQTRLLHFRLRTQ
jgi:fucose permease